MQKLFFFMALVLVFSSSAFAQHTGQEHGEEAVFHPHHTFGLVISHTQVSEGVSEGGKRKWLSLPSWGLNYNYKFSPKWAIGLHTDIITESFKVDEHLNGSSNEVIERSSPVATALMASFKPGEHFIFLLGGGGEFAHAANYLLIRLGLEYEYHLNKNWELNANITNDLKVNAYNSWSVGMGITKIFQSKKHPL